MLKRLETANNFIELLTRSQIIQGYFKGPFGNAQQVGRASEGRFVDSISQRINIEGNLFARHLVECQRAEMAAILGWDSLHSQPFCVRTDQYHAFRSCHQITICTCSHRDKKLTPTHSSPFNPRFSGVAIKSGCSLLPSNQQQLLSAELLGKIGSF